MKIRKKMRQVKTWLRQDQKRTTVLMFVLLFAIIGTIALISSRAASPAVSVEAENATLTGNAVKITDNTASKGSAIQFQSGAIPPPPSGLTNGYRIGIATGYPYVSDSTGKFSMSYTSYVNKVASLGVRWIRTDAIINGTQPLTVMDETLTASKANGIKVVAVFNYGDMSNPSQLNSRMTAYVDHWKSLGIDSALGGYEMWNEPNNGGDPRFGLQDPAQYRTWLRSAYPLLKARTPNVPVILGGFSPGGGNAACCNGNLGNPADYLNKIYQLNGNSSSGIFDHVSMHPYANSSSDYPEGNQPGSGMRVPYYLRQVMNLYGDQNKQIWGTEGGWVSCGNNNGGPSPFTEAQRSTRLINDLNEWFYGTHDSTGKRIGFAANSDLNTGPYMIFKLYKAGTGGSDDDHGLIYTNVDTCNGQPNLYEPPIVNVLKFYSAGDVLNVPKAITQ